MILSLKFAQYPMVVLMTIFHGNSPPGTNLAKRYMPADNNCNGISLKRESERASDEQIFQAEKNGLNNE